MKILHVNRSDIEGGAARAAFRLQQAIKYYESEAHMLVHSKSSDEASVIGPSTKSEKGINKLRPTLDLLPTHHYKDRTKTLFSPAWVPFSSTAEKINILNPDIVHLHWVAGGMMRIEDLNKIKAPIVWSLHDMWPFTGGCHYSEGCEGFKTNCGKCKVLSSHKENDLSRKVFYRKQKTFRKKNITVIGVSHWLANEAKASTLFSSLPVISLPNSIDTDTFAPFSRTEARNLLNLPLNKKLVLFGAIRATNDPRKGFNELNDALHKISSGDVEQVVFGSSRPEKSLPSSHKVHYLGHLHDDVALRILYSAADVMVVPSLQEAFGQTATEAMACGTPVVAFGATGLLDIVDHKEDGYLAQPYDTADLARGIDWVLNYGEYESLRANAREKVANNFDYRIVAPKYIDLYRSVLEKEST